MEVLGNKSEAERLLNEENIGRLAMSSENKPYIVPLCYVYEQGCIYIHSGKKGQKLEFISKNEQVCFQVDRVSGIKGSSSPCKYNINSRSVLLFGRAEEVACSEEKLMALNSLTKAFAGNKPVKSMAQESIDNVTVIKIHVDRMTVRIIGS